MKKTLLTAAAVTAITGIASVQAQASDYEVRSGDTLWTIAQENGTSVSQLKQLNALDSDLIHVGDKIKVESKDFYVVKKDDTLKSIADKFDVKAAELKTWNNLSSNELKVGKKIIVSEEGFKKAQTKAKAVVAMKPVDAPVNAHSSEPAAVVSTHETAQTEAPTSDNHVETTADNTAQAQTATEQTSYKAAEPVSGNVASVANGVASGKSYVYGANSASAVDCSAFAQQVLASMGKSIPRTTYAQMAAGTPVTDPQPGDLVFFNGGSHVGVYVGNGQMVDALNPSEGIAQRAVSYVDGSVTGYYRY